MMQTVRIIYWILVGIWIAATVIIALEANREEGGAMPIAVIALPVWVVGGLIVFLLLHILLRKIT